VRRIATTFFEFVKNTFEDPMLRVLCLAAVVSLVLGISTDGIQDGWLEGTSILVAICLIVSVTSINNYLKEQQFNKLNDIATKKDVNVVRDG
jgi:Ca2+ transporting ATPase